MRCELEQGVNSNIQGKLETTRELETTHELETPSCHVQHPFGMISCQIVPIMPIMPSNLKHAPWSYPDAAAAGAAAAAASAATSAACI